VLPVFLFFVWLAGGGFPAQALAAGPEVRPAPVAVNRPAPVSPPATARAQAPLRKGANIKLHRNAKGEYTWDISGGNVEEIIRLDRRLRNGMASQE